MKRYKIFSDLTFTPHFSKLGGIRAYLEFDNGYGVSVIKTPFSYGNDKGLYELAVLKGKELCYNTSITDDVIGYLDEKAVSSTMVKIQKLAKV